MPIHEIRHPLVRHKIGLMREGDISTKKFRELTAEIARLLAYEACQDFPLETVEIEGWAGPVQIEQIKGKKVTVVPILRAGLGMLDGVLDMMPSAKVSVVGIARELRSEAPSLVMRAVKWLMARRPPVFPHDAEGFTNLGCTFAAAMH